MLKICLSLMIVTSMVSCSKKNAPAPGVKKLSYQFKVLTAMAPLTSTAHGLRLNTMTLGTAIGNIDWKSGFANVLAISFTGKNDNINNDGNNNTNTDDIFIEPSVYNVDLFGGNQLLGNVDIAKGTYHNVEFKVELKSTSTEPAFYLKGIYASTNGSKPIELSLNEGSDQFEVLVTAKDLTVGSKDSYVAFINMHLDKLMTGVSTADLDIATIINGTILINQDNNTSIYAKIKANINSFSDGDYNYNN